MPEKVTEPTKIVTDTYIAKALLEQGINKDYVELWQDYSKENPSTKIYRDLISGKRIAVCQALPKVRSDGLKICGSNPNETTVGWEDKGNGKFEAKPNVFEATVEDKLVKLSFNGDDLEWKPQIFLDKIEQFCEDATLLGIDPTNENYFNNVLDWNYGCCRRRLRVIEGGIFDRKIVESNPHGEVRVKINQFGDLKLSLFGAIDAEGNSLGRVEGDEEIVSAEEFDKAIYPVTIGASLTVYSTASDALVEVDEASTTWTAVREASGETILFATGIYIQTQTHFVAPARFIIRRTFLYFDTSAIGAGFTVTAATLSLYKYGTQMETDAGHADNAITQGVQDDPLVTSNYGDQLAYSTRGSDTDFAYPLTTGDYTDKALNATGYGWVSLTGTTKFCLRVAGDLDNLTPSGSNLMTFYANEKGTGYQPKLVITYCIVTTVTPATATLTLTSYAPVLISETVITPTTASLTTTSYAPTLLREDTITVGTASLTTTGYAPVLVLEEVVTPSVLALTITPYVPVLEEVTTPTTLALGITAYIPVLKEVVTPSTLSLTITGRQPILYLVEFRHITPSTTVREIQPFTNVRERTDPDTIKVRELE